MKHAELTEKFMEIISEYEEAMMDDLMDLFLDNPQECKENKKVKEAFEILSSKKKSWTIVDENKSFMVPETPETYLSSNNTTPFQFINNAVVEQCCFGDSPSVKIPFSISISFVPFDYKKVISNEKVIESIEQEN